jgi:hypothetical protein
MAIQNKSFALYSRGFTYKQLNGPSSPLNGDSWFNIVTGEVRFYNGHD